MGKKRVVELLSSITGKSTTMTAKSLAGVKVKLQTKIRKLENKDNLSADEKKELKNLKSQLKDVNAEMAEESTKAGRSMQQKARDKKMKEKITLPESFEEFKRDKDFEKAEYEYDEIKARGKRGSGLKKGGLIAPKANQKGLKKLPQAVRNKMGYMKRGGTMKTGHMDMRKGGMFYK